MSSEEEKNASIHADIIKKIVKTFVVIALFMLLGGGIGEVLSRQEAKYNYLPYINNPKEYDVLFFGSSHASDAYFPLFLWKDYNITSYNLATACDRIPSAYWKLRYALNENRPKVVVIDCAYMYYDEKYGTVEMLHNFWDAFPINKIKIEAVYDLVDDNVERLGLLSKFVMYHERWDSIDKVMFEAPISTWRYGSNYCIGHPEETVNFFHQVKEAVPINTDGSKYLAMMVKLCKERDVDVILTYIPFEGNEKSQNDANYARELAELYGVDYIDYSLENVVDENISFYDKLDDNAHLNMIGSWQCTNYIGEYLTNKYTDINERNASEEWEHNYSTYIDYVRGCLNEGENSQRLSYYLQYLYNREFNLYLVGKNSVITGLPSYDKVSRQLNLADLDTESESACIIQFNVDKPTKINSIAKNGIEIEDIEITGEMASFCWGENTFTANLDSELILIVYGSEGQIIACTVFDSQGQKVRLEERE